MYLQKVIGQKSLFADTLKIANANNRIRIRIQIRISKW